jgi:hypothetical protein
LIVHLRWLLRLRRLARWAANFMRASVRCAFPLGTLLAWAVLLFIAQGRDVQRRIVERAEVDKSLNDVAFLAIASVVLALSLWYSMRWLLGAQMKSLPLAGPSTTWARTWLPRLAGAAAPALAAAGFFALRGGPGGQEALVFGAAFALLATLLLVFFWGRGRWMRGAPGRSAQGAPARLGSRSALPAFTLCLLGWSLALTFVFAVVFSRYALSFPRVVGAASAAGLALASINLFGSFVLTYWPLRRGLPPLVPWVLLYAVAVGACNDNHTGAPAGPMQAARPLPADAHAAWRRSHGGADHRVLLVAAEGGGIRAAYWTAAVLDELKAQWPGFERRLFALSGVSGGSVGAAAWVAAERPAYCDGTPPPLRATQGLASDFLSPAIAGLFYYDLMQRFMPWPVERFDRSRGLEEGWQRAFSGVPQQPFERTLGELYRDCPALPQLLLNATVAETGQRAILSALQTQAFVDSYDVMDPALTQGSALSLASLAHHSARFPLISPPGGVAASPPRDRPAARLLDGGYFDNSGVQTAAELARELAAAGVQSTLIVISNTAYGSSDCKQPPAASSVRRPAPQVWRWLHETSPPVRGIFKVRDSHLEIALERARSELQGRVHTIRPLCDAGDNEAPLGWALSARVRDSLAERAKFAVAAALLSLRQEPGP